MRGLLGAIPVVPHWRLSVLPQYLPAEDVERLITCCDPTSRVGKRDLAILLLLARLGLRAGDIVQMRLSDIDWSGAWLHVSGKSRRQTRLPLTIVRSAHADSRDRIARQSGWEAHCVARNTPEC